MIHKIDTPNLTNIDNINEPEEPGSRKPQSKGWGDWRWQLKNRIKSSDGLKNLLSKEHFSLSEEISKTEQSFPLAITPYYFSLIRKFDYSDPIFSQCIPNPLELDNPSFLSNDPLHEEEDTVMDGLVHRYPDRALIVSTSQCSMYCRHSLCDKTKITMSNFTQKDIKDIIIGDTVITHTGGIGTVYDVFNRTYKKDVLILKTSRSQKIETTQEHPFLILKRKDILCNCGEKCVCKPNRKQCAKRHPNRVTEFKPNFINASEIEIGDYVCIPIPKTNNLPLQNYKLYENEEMAYLFGLYVAEGDIPKRKNGKPICIRFSLNKTEEKTLARKIEIIVKRQKLGKITIKTNKNKSNCCVRIYNADLAKEIESLFGRYSDKKTISESIINFATDGFKKKLLDGMLDGDGYFSNKHKIHTKAKSIEFNTVSENLSSQIFMLLVSLGYMPSIYHQEENRTDVCINGRKLNNLKIMHKIRILDENGYNKWLGIQKDTISSKSESFIHNGYIFCRVSDILKRKPFVKEIFYDLSVTGDESYLAEFASVHNCTRKRVAGSKDYHLTDCQLEKIVEYLTLHSEIKDVIISGGDAFTMSTSKLEKIISKIRSVKSVEIIRIGTRTPVVMPQRITSELVNMINKYHPIFVNTHFNHPNELTEESKKACLKMIEKGIPVNNQSVLLKGINDDPVVMAELCRKLLTFRVRPYYIFSCDKVTGTNHFQTSIEKGLEVMDYLRKHISGLGVPSFIVDLQDGKGKIPLLPNYIKEIKKDTVIFQNLFGGISEYPRVN